MDVTWLRIAVLAVLGLGLALALTGIIGALRKQKSRVLWPFLIGALLVAPAGWVIYQYWASFKLMFQTDYTVPERELIEIKGHIQQAMEVPADGWPGWRGPGRSGIAQAVAFGTAWDKHPPRVVWRKPLGGGYSSVIVVGDKVYATALLQENGNTYEAVVCLAAADGKKLWEYRYAVDYADLDYRDGPRATPLWHAGRLYVLGATGEFLCLDAAQEEPQARLLWRVSLRDSFQAPVPRWGFASSPLVVGDKVIVQPGARGSSVVAFHKETGNILWRALDDPNGYSSPVAANCGGVPQVIVFTARGVAGLEEKTGQPLWYYPWETEFDCNIATPIVAGDYVFISSDYDAGCALLRVTGSAPRQQVQPVYVRRRKLMRNHHASCVLHRGYLFGFDVSGFGGVGILKCIEMATGQEKWFTRDLVKGTVIVSGNLLISLSEDGQLSVADASPEGFRLHGQMQVFHTGRVWCTPALVGRRLYLRDNREIVCLELPPMEDAQPAAQ